jgi:hypothetical protein
MKNLHEKINQTLIDGLKFKITKIQEEQTEYKKELNRLNVLVLRNRGRLTQMLAEFKKLKGE